MIKKVLRISQVEGRPIRIKVNGQKLEKVKVLLPRKSGD